MVRRDITDVRPYILKKGGETIQHMKTSGNYSRSKLRKLGILPNPWKKPKPGWKHRR